MMSRLERTKQNTKMARLNIAYHIGNNARRNNLSAEEAVTVFMTALRTGTASPYLIGASKIADSDNNYLTHKRVVRWVKNWQNNVPDGQKAKFRREKNPVDVMRVARSRETIAKHILSRQSQFKTSRGAEIKHFLNRLRTARLPNYLRDAVRYGHARPGDKQDISIARCTIFTWIRVYLASGRDLEALKPLPSCVPKPIYANDNTPIEKYR